MPKRTRAAAEIGTRARKPRNSARSGAVGWPAGPGVKFSLCATLWEALYGQRAHTGADYSALARAVCSGIINQPPRNASVPAWLRRVVARGLSVKRVDRHANVRELMAALSADPSRRRRSFALVLSAALAIGAWLGVARLQHERAVAACDDAGRVIDEVWNANKSAALRAGLVGTGLSFAPTTADKVAPWLDEHAAEWRAARVAICRAELVDGDLSAALADTAERCLDERREHLSSLVEFLSNPGDGVLRSSVVRGALMAATKLPSVAPCGDTSWLSRRPDLPKDRDSRAEVRRLRAALAKAAALEGAGRYEDGMTVVNSAQADADALGWAPIRAAAAFRRGSLHRELGAYEAAEAALESAFFLAGRASEDVLAADAAVRLAWIVGYRTGRPADGLRWGAVAEMLFDRAGVAAGDLRRAALLNSMGVSYTRKGDHDRASELLERALTIRTKALGPEHPAVATSLNNLGASDFERGLYERALESYERALAIREMSLGPDHPELVNSLHNLAVLRHERGELERALVYNKRALEIGTRAFGGDHPIVSGVLGNLGTIYHKRGEYALAVEHHERALAIAEKTLGLESPDLTTPLSNLGMIYLERGEYERAVEYHERARAITTKALGPEHPTLAISLSNIANVHARRGAHELSVEYNERARVILEKALGREHPSLRNVHNNLAIAHEARGAYDQAILHHERAMALAEMVRGADHPDLAFSLTGLGRVLTLQGRHEEARALLERALTLREANEVPATHRAYTRFALARALWTAPDQRARAERLARQARDTYDHAGKGFARELAEVDAWLAERLAPG